MGKEEGRKVGREGGVMEFHRITLQLPRLENAIKGETDYRPK